MSEERTCKTCHGFNSDAFFCRPLDTSMAEWDTCRDHETYDALVARMQTSEVGARETKVSKPECFGKDVVVSGTKGHYCKHHPYCLFLDDCYRILIETLFRTLQR